MKRMVLPALAALVLVVALAAAAARAEGPAKPPSTEDAQVAQLADAKWAAPKIPNFPAGVMGAPIAVDPASGGSIGYAKFAPGTHFPMHWHSATEYTVVLAGKATLVVDGKTTQIGPGSYFVIPPKAHHSLDCAAGTECVVMTRRAGPTDYNWVK